MDRSPIGVFDSGLGGLTVVRELEKLLPNEDIVYFGDTARVPYGSRSRETILRYAQQDMNFLLSKNVKMIIAACGTVSSVYGNGESLSVPYTGVVKPAAAAAVKATKNAKIGITGTQATIASRSYAKEIGRELCDAKLFEKACSLFVPLVENGFVDPQDPLPEMVVRRYLEYMLEEGIDTLILGCTHFPILAPIISKVMGDGVTLIDPGAETARFAADMLKERGLLSDSQNKGSHSFFVSDRTEGFSAVAGTFLGEDISGSVNRVDISSL
ncbi:MAG: glutamate racemase [Clostridia bacterium]|nr:glutamate racemase [Clostridia bacterium]